MIDTYKSLRNEEERKQRESLLAEEHSQPLVRFVQGIRDEQQLNKEIPNFDPLDGGVWAECLFVLEAPGRKAVESGFISRNNDDETAKNFFQFNELVGLARKRAIIWNIVPWYIGNGGKIRAANHEDIQKGLPYLFKLLKILHNLKAIVLIGGSAQSIRPKLETQTNINILTCHHPSPVWVNRNPQKNKQIIISELENVKNFLNENRDKIF
jgi:uracil-DNA glycosylase